jgi:hypothetical protein
MDRGMRRNMKFLCNPSRRKNSKRLAVCLAAGAVDSLLSKVRSMAGCRGDAMTFYVDLRGDPPYVRVRVAPAAFVMALLSKIITMGALCRAHGHQAVSSW